MTDWDSAKKNFLNSPDFKKIDEILSTIAENANADAESSSAFVRITKALNFVKGAAEGIDPYITPVGVWSNGAQRLNSVTTELSNYKKNGNISHLTNANNNIDPLLTQFHPYVLPDNNTAKLLGRSTTGVVSRIKRLSNDMVSQYTAASQNLAKLRKEAENDANAAKAAAERARQSEIDLTNEDGPAVRLTTLLTDLEKRGGAITAFSDKLFGSQESPTQKGLQEQFEEADEIATKTLKNIEVTQSSVEDTLNDVNSIQKRFTGDGGDELGLIATVENLIHKVEDRHEQFEIANKSLSAEIEALLPGATTAGLATTFVEQRDEFNGHIRWSSIQFFFAIGMLLLLALGSEIDLSALMSGEWERIFRTDKSIEEALQRFAVKVPLALPLVWLALHAGKKRSQLQRLREEYRHKVAVAMAYSGFKAQIEVLDENERADLLKSLLVVAVHTLGQNPSGSMDGKHEEDIPASSLLKSLFDKISIPKITL